MADDITIKDAASADKVMAADDIGGGRLAQIVKIYIGPDGQAYFLANGAGATDSGTLRVVLANDDPVAAVAAGGATTVTTTLTRPSDTNVYAAGDSMANATSGAAATVFDDASRGSGKSGLITDIILGQKVAPGTLLQGELWLFDSQPAPLNDNAAWALADTDIPRLVAVVPFTMVASGSTASNAYCHLDGLNIGFTTVGDDKLYGLIKVTNAYTPSSAEELTIRLKIVRSN